MSGDISIECEKIRRITKPAMQTLDKSSATNATWSLQNRAVDGSSTGTDAMASRPRQRPATRARSASHPARNFAKPSDDVVRIGFDQTCSRRHVTSALSRFMAIYARRELRVHHHGKRMILAQGRSPGCTSGGTVYQEVNRHRPTTRTKRMGMIKMTAWCGRFALKVLVISTTDRSS